MAQEVLIAGVGGILKAVVGKLTDLAGKEIGLFWYAKDDLRKLRDTLETIVAILATAENLQVSDHASVLWLKKLKDIAYDAEDVAGEVSYVGMRQSERGDQWRKQASDFFSSSNHLVFSYEVAKKVKDINNRLDAIKRNNNMSRLPPTNIIPTARDEISLQRSRRETSPRITQSIVGRKDDKNKIIRLLITSGKPSAAGYNFQNNQYPGKMSVVSIVGMGGIGKTALAGLIYKDKAMEEFNPKIWVCVAGDFDASTVLLQILKCIIPETNLNNSATLGALENQVEEQLMGKKYLLVLDDMWNVRAHEWEKLTNVLAAGNQDSKVLITAREIQDAVKGGTHPYKLKQLQDDECWSITKTKAFSPGGARPLPDMISIGEEIAKLCRGSPLAAKTLGSLMHSKNTRKGWLSIKDNDVWNAPGNLNDIIPILKLSYDNLSSKVKQCFSYCSIFPKNWEINKVTLVQLWIAEGFLDTLNVGNGRHIEDIAGEYFESLVWSSLLDGVQKSSLLDGVQKGSLLDGVKKSSWNDMVTYKMHDLVHDLARAVAGDHDLSYLKVNELNTSSEIRRLRLELDEDISATFLKSSLQVKKLRTLFIPGGSKLDPCIFSENNHLRILHVGRSPRPTLIPKLHSLSFKLKHLRYLSLTSLDLREVENDQCINKLYNLETLILNSMGGVQILLTNIQPLKKLRYLEVSWTDMVELPDSVTSLGNLQTLDLNHCELKVIPDFISSLKNLRFLNLSFNPIEELPVSLFTLSNLETLDVNSCKILKALPESVAGSSKLGIFDFENCPLLKALPEDFGALTQLRYLSLYRTAITVLPESCANLRNIEYLNLYKCRVPNNVGNWTELREVYYLVMKPTSGIGKLVCLQNLVYTVPEKIINEPECNVGIEELANLNFLEGVTISNLQNVKDPIDAQRANFKGKKNLRSLALHWDTIQEDLSMRFQVFEALQPPPTCLIELRIENFMGCDLPTWMCPSGLPNLECLVFQNCQGIKQLPSSIGQLPCLRHLVLGGLKSLKSFDIGGFRCLMYLGLEKVDLKLVRSVGRSQITSLTKLTLTNIEDLTYFPISILQNNCNLQFLHIIRCNQFQGFRVIDDENEKVVPMYGPELYGVSLHELLLMNCPVLKFLPDLRRWTSLQILYIFDCPLVKEYLTYDLKSLSFIKRLYVDFIIRDTLQRGYPSAADDFIHFLKKLQFIIQQRNKNGFD